MDTVKDHWLNTMQPRLRAVIAGCDEKYLRDTIRTAQTNLCSGTAYDVETVAYYKKHYLRCLFILRALLNDINEDSLLDLVFRAYLPDLDRHNTGQLYEELKIFTDNLPEIMEGKYQAEATNG